MSKIGGRKQTWFTSNIVQQLSCEYKFHYWGQSSKFLDTSIKTVDDKIETSVYRKQIGCLYTGHPKFPTVIKGT